MINETKLLKHEILKVRDQLNRFVEQNGISQEPELIDLSCKLDELILKWEKRNK